MKMLKSNKDAFAGNQVLTREQLKKVIGGGPLLSDIEGCSNQGDPCGPTGCCRGLDCSDDNVCIKE